MNRLPVFGGPLTIAAVSSERTYSAVVSLDDVDQAGVIEVRLAPPPAAPSDVGIGHARLEVSRDRNGLTMVAVVVLEAPLEAVKISMVGFADGQVVAPPGVVYEVPRDTGRCFAYPADGGLPVRWRGGETGVDPATGPLPGITHQFLAIEHATTTTLVHSLDRERRFKRFWVRNWGGEVVVELLEEAPAHAVPKELRVEWRVARYGSVSSATEAYMAWSDTHMPRPTKAPAPPKWLARKALVLNFHGISSDERRLYDYAGILADLTRISQRFPLEHTIVRLVGWEGRVDHSLPTNRASDLLGEDEGLAGLIEAIHAFGAHVLLHFNIWGVAYGHPDFGVLAEHAVLDRRGRRTGWEVDYNGDEVLEPIFLYVSPDAAPFRERLTEAIDFAVRAYRPDGVHLDQAAFPVNDLHHDHQRGVEAVFHELARLHPQVLLTGEGFSEWTSGLYPLCEGLSNVWPGLEVRPEVFRRTFTTYVTPYAHSYSLPPTPVPGVWSYPPVRQWWSRERFMAQEAFYDRLGVLPALALTEPGLDLDDDLVQVVLARARRRLGRRPERA